MNTIVSMLRQAVYDPIILACLDRRKTVQGLEWIATRILPSSRSMTTEEVAEFFGSRCAAQFEYNLACPTWAPVSTVSFAVVPLAQLAGDDRDVVVGTAQDTSWPDNIVEIIDFAVYQPGDVICRVSSERTAHIFLRDEIEWTFTRWTYHQWVNEVRDAMTNPDDELCKAADLRGRNIEDMDAVLAAAREARIGVLTSSRQEGEETVKLHAAPPQLVRRFLRGEIVRRLHDVSGDPERGFAEGRRKVLYD